MISNIKRSAQKGRVQLQLCVCHKQTKLRSMSIIACTCKLELFKNPINDFKHQEISAERERSIASVCQRNKQTKLRSMSIITCKFKLFKKPINDFKHQEISAERGRSIAIVSAP
jgi:hypothetical protein